jgi:CRP/FNR family transcriptional regulator, anaerobic regulatory protein
MDDSLCELVACLLCDAQLYSGLTLMQVCRTHGFSCMQSFEPGAVLFWAGSASTHFFVLRRGQVKLMMMAANGREQIIGLAVPGQLLGVTTLEEPVYPCTAKALTQSSVCRIAYHELVNVLESNPRVSLRLVQLLNQELRRTRALLQTLGRKSSVEKVASFILSLMPARGQAGTDLALPLSRDEIASLLGLTVETVSRVMADLRRRRIIDAPRGRIRILDHAVLESLADGASRSPGSAGAAGPACG